MLFLNQNKNSNALNYHNISGSGNSNGSNSIEAEKLNSEIQALLEKIDYLNSAIELTASKITYWRKVFEADMNSPNPEGTLKSPYTGEMKDITVIDYLVKRLDKLRRELQRKIISKDIKITSLEELIGKPSTYKKNDNNGNGDNGSEADLKTKYLVYGVVGLALLSVVIVIIKRI